MEPVFNWSLYGRLECSNLETFLQRNYRTTFGTYSVYLLLQFYKTQVVTDLSTGEPSAAKAMVCQQ